jgi:hypothetical protein
MTTSSALTCRELVELVTDYFEDVLSPVDRARFEDHASGCGGCAAYLEQMGKTIALVGRLTEEDVSPEAEEELLAAFRDWKGPRTL